MLFDILGRDGNGFDRRLLVLAGLEGLDRGNVTARQTAEEIIPAVIADALCVEQPRLVFLIGRQSRLPVCFVGIHGTAGLPCFARLSVLHVQGAGTVETIVIAAGIILKVFGIKLICPRVVAGSAVDIGRDVCFECLLIDLRSFIVDRNGSGNIMVSDRVLFHVDVGVDGRRSAKIFRVIVVHIQRFERASRVACEAASDVGNACGLVHGDGEQACRLSTDSTPGEVGPFRSRRAELFPEGSDVIRYRGFRSRFIY